jgi:hypothetical protein
MSRITKYTCDICDETIDRHEDAIAKLLGIKFTMGNSWAAGAVPESGKHVCWKCAGAISEIVKQAKELKEVNVKPR